MEKKQSRILPNGGDCWHGLSAFPFNLIASPRWYAYWNSFFVVVAGVSVGANAVSSFWKQASPGSPATRSPQGCPEKHAYSST